MSTPFVHNVLVGFLGAQPKATTTKPHHSAFWKAAYAARRNRCRTTEGQARRSLWWVHRRRPRARPGISKARLPQKTKYPLGAWLAVRPEGNPVLTASGSPKILRSLHHLKALTDHYLSSSATFGGQPRRGPWLQSISSDDAEPIRPQVTRTPHWEFQGNRRIQDRMP